MESVRKRRHDDRAESPEAPSMLGRLRNMWQFASLCQWFYIFGGVVKLDNLDIDDLEARCLSPHSTILQDIGLALLKFLSSHRGLTNDLFDEYTRRQYTSKAPGLPNPFGNDEIPSKFSSFTVFERIRILHQMTSFVMMNPEKLREKMAEQRDADHDQTAWRIEPFGWDRDDRSYYVLDDNRVYRLTEAPLVLPKPKKNTKKARAQARRNSKRRRISSTPLDSAVEGAEYDSEKQVDEKSPIGEENAEEDIDDGLGGMKWECIAVSLDDLRALLASISSKKDPNERILHEKIAEHLLPILEQQEERRKKREREREKELLNLAKMASAKRSSRIAGRQEQQKQEEMLREEEQKRRLELDALRKQEQKQRRVERERDNRLLSRDKRLHEREARRAQHEDELAQLSEDSKAFDHAAGRMSERRRLAEIEKNKEALRELDEEGEEEEWTFDCICGLHGKVDDGQHSVSCENCNIWQHSKCLGIDEQEAEKDDFHFVCDPCKRKASDMANWHPSGRPVIRIKINESAAKTPPEPFPRRINIPVAHRPESTLPKPVLLPGPVPTQDKKLEVGQAGFDADHLGVNSDAGLPTTAPPFLGPPQLSNGGGSSVPVKVDGLTTLQKLTSTNKANVGHASAPESTQYGLANPFSLPHPGLLQPDQSPRRSHAYGTIHEQPGPVLPHGLLPQSVVYLGPPTPTTSVPTSSTQLGHIQRTPTSLATPRLHHVQGASQGTNQTEQSSSPLLSSHVGLSPTKHSPTIARGQADVLPGANLTPSIIPPTAALSPSTPEQILIPPVKPEGLAHRQSFSGMATDLISPPRVPES